MPKVRKRLLILVFHLLLCLFCLTLPAPPFQAASASFSSPLLRVGITLPNNFLKVAFSDCYRLIDRGSDLTVDIPPGEYTFSAAGNGVEIRDSSGKNTGYLSSSFYLEALNDPADSFFEIKNASYGEKYRGELEIWREGGYQQVSAINVIDLETYLRGVVAREMPSSWGNYGGGEALKAQAVAARTYALYQQASQRHSGYHLCDSQHCQVYGGKDAEFSQTDLAVAGTRGELLTYGGGIIEPVYHATNGGFTEASENVWGYAFPYLRSEPDPFDDPHNPLGLGNMVIHAHASWETDIPCEKAAFLLAAKGMTDLGRVERMIASSVLPSGRVGELSVLGAGGEKITFRQEQVRTVLGTEKIKSLLFTVGEETEPRVWIASSVSGVTRKICCRELEGKWVAGKVGMKRMLLGNYFSALGPGGSSSVPYASFVFRGQGYGHGVGMSQNGAYNRSRQGHDYREILSFYYPGAEITSGY